MSYYSISSKLGRPAGWSVVLKLFGKKFNQKFALKLWKSLIKSCSETLEKFHQNLAQAFSKLEGMLTHRFTGLICIIACVIALVFCHLVFAPNLYCFPVNVLRTVKASLIQNAEQELSDLTGGEAGGDPSILSIEESAFVLEIQGTQPIDYQTMFVEANEENQQRYCIDVNNSRNRIRLDDISVSKSDDPSLSMPLSELLESTSFPISKMVVAQHTLTPPVTRLVFHLRHQVDPITEANNELLTVKIPVYDDQYLVKATDSRDREITSSVENSTAALGRQESNPQAIPRERPAIINKITPVYLPKTTKLEMESDGQLKIKQVRLSKGGILRIEIFNATTSLPSSININRGILRSVISEVEAGEMSLYINLTEPVIYEVENTDLGMTVTFQNPVLEQLISLNVNNESLSTVLLMLFSQYGANIIAGSNISGRITVRLVDVPLKAALNEILMAEGYAYVEENGLIRVVRAEDLEAKKTSERASQLLQIPTEIESQIFELKNAKASEMQQLLQKIVGNDCNVVVDARTNSVILISATDSARFQKHAEKVGELISKLDKEVVDESVTTPDHLMGTTSAEKLVIPEVETEVKIAKRVFRLNYTDPDKAKAILLPLLSDKGTIEAVKDQEKEKKGTGSEGSQSGMSMAGGRGTAGEGIQLGEPVGQGGYVVVSDREDVVEQIEKEIAKFDLPVPQVEIEAYIVEDVLSNDKELGIDWTAISKGDDMSLSFTRDQGAVVTKGVIPFDKFIGILNVLINRADISVRSNPCITTLEGQPAIFHSGDKIPYSKIYIQEGIEQVDTVFEEVGIVLAATPYVKDNNMISLVLTTSVSSEGGFTPSGQPRIATRTTRSQVLVKSGYTVIIAGLISEKNGTTVSKVPIIGDIPLIGRVFSTESAVKQRSKVTIFITPRIVVNASEGVSQ